MRISRVRIDNYRNLRHVDVELGNIVALIGENNSGKSNFLRALSIPLSSDDPERLHRIFEATEHYDVKDILVDKDSWTGGILYQFFIKKPEELLNRIRSVLINEAEDDNVQMSLLPMELYDYSITVPGKGNKIPYDILSRFRTVELPAERDNFASDADRLGSKALSDLLQKGLTSGSQVKIEMKNRVPCILTELLQVSTNTAPINVVNRVST